MSSPVIKSKVKLFKQQLAQQRYAHSTIKAYGNCLKKFLKDFDQSSLEQVQEKNIENHIIHIINSENLSTSCQKQLIVTITKYYQLTFHKKLNLEHLQPKRKQNQIPKHLTQDEVRRMLNHTYNIKHLCIMKLLYGAGLRVSELLALKIKDLDTAQLRILVRGTQKNKDRHLTLSPHLLTDIKTYFKLYQPKKHLFEGQNKSAYSARSVQNIVKQAAKRAGMTKKVNPQMLRHSFATHLVQNGTDIRHIQKLLGHSSIKTTQIYTLITHSKKIKIKSPLDSL